MRTLTVAEIGFLLDAHTSTHTKSKIFGTGDLALYRNMLSMGYVKPKTNDAIGYRTTAEGDRIVEAIVAASGKPLHKSAMDEFQDTLKCDDSDIPAFIDTFDAEVQELFETGSVTFPYYSNGVETMFCLTLNIERVN